METGDGRNVCQINIKLQKPDPRTITKNEILTALNKPHDFILAIVEVDGDKSIPRYVRRPFRREPDFGVTSVNYDLGELLAKARDTGVRLQFSIL
jgi:hypothetical protein